MNKEYSEKEFFLLMKKMISDQERAQCLRREAEALRQRLREVESEIRHLEIQMSTECSHEWGSFREPGMYGEKYFYCKKCGMDRYTKTKMHLDLLRSESSAKQN
jgi:hypothetical protein